MKAGFFVSVFYLLAMAVVSYMMLVFYSEIVLSTDGKHRLPGYAQKYLGNNWKNISFFIIFVSFVCALLAYLIIGGQFLFVAFSSIFGGSYLLYFFLFFILGSFVIFREIKMVSKTEIVMLVIMALILFWIFISALPKINISNFSGFNANFLFFPYGAMIFSLWGASIIPELKEMISKGERRKTLKKTILFGIIIAVLVYFVFIVSILGVSGKNTSADAVSGLFSLGSGIVRISAIFGFLCCFTSFITIGLTLKKSLQYDLRIPGFISWIITIFVPLTIYFLGAKDFIGVIGFAGSIAVGFEALLIILIYRACFRKKLSLEYKIFSCALSVVFILGILLEIRYFLV